MAKVKALENYTEALRKVEQFREKNSKVIATFDALYLALREAETALKVFVKNEVKGNIRNEDVIVTYSPAFKKYYDPRIVLDMVTPSLKKKMIEAGALFLEEKVDSVKFTEMVEEGAIPVTIKQEAFKEEELAPRVTIKAAK